MLYNKLKLRQNKVLEKFEAVYDCLHERIELIDNIISLIKKENYHEETLIRDLTTLKKELLTENINNNLLLLINKSHTLIVRALNIKATYPSLGDNKDFQDIIETFQNNQTKITYALEIYNEEVKVYDDYKKKAIINVIAKVFFFSTYNYYKTENNVSL